MPWGVSEPLEYRTARCHSWLPQMEERNAQGQKVLRQKRSLLNQEPIPHSQPGWEEPLPTLTPLEGRHGEGTPGPDFIWEAQPTTHPPKPLRQPSVMPGTGVLAIQAPRLSGTFLASKAGAQGPPTKCCGHCSAEIQFSCCCTLPESWEVVGKNFPTCI